VSQALARIRQAAKLRKKERFTSLLHHVSVDLLRLSFFALKKDAAPGVDGLAWRDYETNLEGNLEDLHDRVHRGAYRALPSRRQYIPKADGRQRPIAICALEDKIVQRAVAMVETRSTKKIFVDFRMDFAPSAASTTRWMR
jgi:retron-type reverse transcriptase